MEWLMIFSSWAAELAAEVSKEGIINTHTLHKQAQRWDYSSTHCSVQAGGYCVQQTVPNYVNLKV